MDSGDKTDSVKGAKHNYKMEKKGEALNAKSL